MQTTASISAAVKKRISRQRQQSKEKLEEAKLDRMAHELFHYKEDMKKRIHSLTSIINFEETDHFIKSTPNPDLLSNKCFEFAYKRDENNHNIAILLLQIKSKKLLTSIYTTWPSLSFEIPSDHLNASMYDTQSVAGGSSIVGSPPMLKSQSKSLHKSVSYHDEMFPVLPNNVQSGAFPSSQSVATNRVTIAAPGSGNTVANKSLHSDHNTVLSNSSHQTNMMKHLDYLTSQQEAMQFAFGKEIDLSSFDFLHTKSLRKIGFTLLQLRDSKCYNWNQLLSAGYPLNEIKYLRGSSATSMTPNSSGHSSSHHDHSFELTVPELRKAGYSIEQCVKAGFNIKAIKAGGFDELQLVQCGLFTTKQLLSAGCDIQRYVLKNFYELLNGKYWKHSDNWNSSLPLSKWYGIKTDPQENIISIDLRSNELHGHLPESLYLLTTLQSLDLYNNRLKAAVPTSYGNLINLKDLWLDGNPDLKAQTTRQQVQRLLPSCRIRL
jgi:Leucine-rich repeat (LRR) protein